MTKIPQITKANNAVPEDFALQVNAHALRTIFYVTAYVQTPWKICNTAAQKAHVATMTKIPQITKANNAVPEDFALQVNAHALRTIFYVTAYVQTPWKICNTAAQKAHVAMMTKIPQITKAKSVTTEKPALQENVHAPKALFYVEIHASIPTSTIRTAVQGEAVRMQTQAPPTTRVRTAAWNRTSYV